MSVINDEDDLEREALDLYKRCMAQAFGRCLATGNGGLSGVERFADEFGDEEAAHLAGTCLTLISAFVEESRTVIEKASELGLGLEGEEKGES